MHVCSRVGIALKLPLGLLKKNKIKLPLEANTLLLFMHIACNGGLQR
jgi:hypothetical protein